MKLNGESGTIERVNTLTFDIFGTVLDLAGSLVPPLDKMLKECNAPASITGLDVWNYWRLRQRLEQYQDNIIMLGHSGYLEVKTFSASLLCGYISTSLNKIRLTHITQVFDFG